MVPFSGPVRDTRTSVCRYLRSWSSSCRAAVFDGRPVVHPASFPSLRDRLVTVGSVSIEQRMIGWRLGWVVAPASVLPDIAVVHIYNAVTPGGIVTQLARICEELGLPHPIHLHCNNLGAPGNISTTLDTVARLEGRRAHIAHSQYHAYGGDGWDTMCSRTADLAAV